MALFRPHEWAFTEKALEWVTTNPFDPDNQVVAGVLAWRPGADLWGPRSVYYDDLHERITKMGERLCRRLKGGASACEASEEELARYELLSVYLLYCQIGEAMDRLIDSAVQGQKKSGEDHSSREEERRRIVKTIWEGFQRSYESLFTFANFNFPTRYEPHHLFACFFVFRRAFYHIFFNIIGTSDAIAKLRSKVWDSIVTHDLLSWMHGLHERMIDIPTLIIGPSGTGKERVAEAIGRSLYIPFDPKKETFEIDFIGSFNPVNLSALPPLLIEAEMFGHVRGAFANAVRDRIGRLEACPERGAVFLDEIGELTPEIQVKMLRVLQTRRFQRVGANEDKEFRGKIIAATNRDLCAEMQARRFREDFYYRLCADQIATPSLGEQLKDRPEDLPIMVEFVCRWVVGEEKAVGFARDVVDWINRNLGGYHWPGNFRELEQCVRSYTIRKEYYPAQPAPTQGNEHAAQPARDRVGEACKELAGSVLNQKITYEEIKRRLFTLVRRATDTDKKAAELLACDVRTLRKQLS
jgi:transcriptional regulator with AAA-type ATPase domain